MRFAQACVSARDEAMRVGFFVARRPDDLASEEEAQWEGDES